jgi:hypothetical protein
MVLFMPKSNTSRCYKSKKSTAGGVALDIWIGIIPLTYLILMLHIVIFKVSDTREVP